MSYDHLLLGLLLLCCETIAEFATKTCPIPNKGKSGSKSSTTVSVYYCIRATSSKKAVCSLWPKRRVVVKKGQTKNLNYNVNGYAVTAKFFGDETCVAYYKVSKIRDNTGYHVTNDCHSECFKTKEKETYHTQLSCGLLGCTGTYQSLKFVASGSLTSMSVSVMLACVSFVLAATGLAS